MSTITTKDGTEIFYKDWGTKDAQPIVFSHGWPLSADAWDAQMVFFANQGFRVIAHDRRSHGRSYAGLGQQHDGPICRRSGRADRSSSICKDVILVGHSTGGGEVTRYLGRHGTGRVAKVVLVGAVPPLMLKTEANPGGLPLDVFDGIRKGTYRQPLAVLLRTSTIPFYGYQPRGRDDLRRHPRRVLAQGMMGGLKGQLDCIKAFSESDFTEDLKKIDVPTLILHGDDDQIVPIGASALMSSKLVKGSTLKIYEGSAHGLAQIEADRFNADVLAFIKG